MAKTLFAVSTAALMVAFVAGWAASQQPSPCCPGGIGPGRYVRNDDKREADACRALCRLFVRVLSEPYSRTLSPGHTGAFFLGRSNGMARAIFFAHHLGCPTG